MCPRPEFQRVSSLGQVIAGLKEEADGCGSRDFDSILVLVQAENGVLHRLGRSNANFFVIPPRRGGDTAGVGGYRRGTPFPRRQNGDFLCKP